MDYLDTIKGTSTLHIKCSKRLHVGMKVEATKAGKSMNQFIVDLLEVALSSSISLDATKEINTPIIPQPTPVKRLPSLNGTKFPDSFGITSSDVQRSAKERGLTNAAQQVDTSRLNNSHICKVHKTPLDLRGKCLQKGCKYA